MKVTGFVRPAYINKIYKIFRTHTHTQDKGKRRRNISFTARLRPSGKPFSNVVSE